jgi:predicted HTH transcriptional regulator
MVASAEFDPIVVEPELSEQKIEELFGRKQESAKLDYKRAYDPEQRRDVVELTKDVIAMANTAGGYVVIGVGDSGEEIGLSEKAVGKLDEAKIRAQLQAYVGTPMDLFLNKTMVRNEKRYAIITVLRSPRSPVVVEKDGQYGEKSVTVFRKGDVFVRHGSASERWNQEDVRVIYARVVEREKERWLAEVMPDVRRLIQAAVPGVAAAPSPHEILHSDAESFERAIRKFVIAPRSG